MINRDGWRGAIDHELPGRLEVGRGTALAVSGWLYHEEATVRDLWICLGGRCTPVIARPLPRMDVDNQDGSRRGPDKRAFASGFVVVVPIPGIFEETTEWLRLCGRTEAGHEIDHEIALVSMVPARAGTGVPTSDALVAICMATYNPPMDLFRAQVDSIRAQTHRNWICIVNDDHSDPEVLDQLRRYVAADPRFEVRTERGRIGFYWNFGRALRRVPDQAAFVALADQDDVWRADKLERLVAAMAPGVTLAYSDQRIVTRDGRVLSDSFWTDRDNYSTGIARMLVSNTVTGAAALFRRDLLDAVLPLPPRVGEAYHDHWLAVVALAHGRLAYVPEPLYDYVQHTDQVLGRHASSDEERGGSWGSDRQHSWLWRTARRWQDRYFERVVAQQLAAATVLERCDLAIPSRRALSGIRDADSSNLALFWCLARAMVENRRFTLGYQRQAATGLIWRRAASAWTGRRSASVDGRFAVRHGIELVDYGPDRT